MLKMILIPTICETNRIRMIKFLIALNAFYLIYGFLLCKAASKIYPIIDIFNQIFNVSYDNYFVFILIFCGLSLIAGGTICMYIFLRAMIPSQRTKKLKTFFWLRLYMVLQSIILLISITLVSREQRNLQNSFKIGILDSMGQYNINLEKKQMIDSIQIKYLCCGNDKYSDWFQVMWSSDNIIPDLEGRLKSGRYSVDDVPFSCCDPGRSRPCINRLIHDNNAHPSYDFNVDLTLHKTGCKEAVGKYMDSKCFWPFFVSMSFFLIFYQLNFIFTSFLDVSIQIARLSGDPKSTTPAYCCEFCYNPSELMSKTDCTSRLPSSACSRNPFYTPNSSAFTFYKNMSNSSSFNECRDNLLDKEETKILNEHFEFPQKLTSTNLENENVLKGFIEICGVQSTRESIVLISPEAKCVRSLPKLSRNY